MVWLTHLAPGLHLLLNDPPRFRHFDVWLQSGSSTLFFVDASLAHSVVRVSARTRGSGIQRQWALQEIKPRNGKGECEPHDAVPHPSLLLSPSPPPGGPSILFDCVSPLHLSNIQNEVNKDTPSMR